MTMLAHDTTAVDGDHGQHPCARGVHCAARTTIVDNGERVTIPAPTYRTFCDADTGHVCACLTDLPRRYLELHARIGDKRRTDGPRVSGGGESSPSPLNLAVDAFLTSTEEILFSWDERVRTAAHLAGLAAATRRQAVATACTVLTAHVTTLLTLPAEAMARSMDLTRREYLPGDATGWVFPDAGWLIENRNRGGADAGVEVLNIHHRALRLLGYTPQHHDLVTACWVEACGERALRRHDGTAGLADHVECQRCGEQYLGSRLRALMVEEDGAQERRRTRLTARNAQVLHGAVAGFGGRP